VHPQNSRKSEEWTRVVSQAEADRVNICQVLKAKGLFGTLYSVYSLILSEFKAFLQNSAAREPASADPTAQVEGELREQQR
jgi:hypothetical protein